MAIEEQHVALPKLYGAPAYARPAPVVESSPKPFDPDEMPITAYQTPEERDFLEALPEHAFNAGGAYFEFQLSRPTVDEPKLQPRSLSLRSLAGRIRGSGGS